MFTREPERENWRKRTMRRHPLNTIVLDLMKNIYEKIMEVNNTIRLKMFEYDNFYV